MSSERVQLLDGTWTSTDRKPRHEPDAEEQIWQGLHEDPEDIPVPDIWEDDLNINWREALDAAQSEDGGWFDEPERDPEAERKEFYISQARALNHLSQPCGSMADEADLCLVITLKPYRAHEVMESWRRLPGAIRCDHHSELDEDGVTLWAFAHSEQFENDQSLGATVMLEWYQPFVANAAVYTQQADGAYVVHRLYQEPEHIPFR